MAPKSKSSNTGSVSKPKRSRDVLSIIEKVEILDMIEVGKKRTRRLAGCVAKKESSIFEVTKN